MDKGEYSAELGAPAVRVLEPLTRAGYFSVLAKAPGKREFLDCSDVFYFTKKPIVYPRLKEKLIFSAALVCERMFIK